jgi:hypothetical protein
MLGHVRNPYTNRKGILNEKEFFGREKELRDVYTRVLGGQSVLLIGERRTGKSSLLYALDFPDERESFGIPESLRFAYADCQEMAGCDEATFLAYLSQQFAMAMNLDEPPEPSRAAFKNLTKTAKGAGLQPVLAIDEFDVLIENSRVGPEFLAFLRSWSTTTNTPIVLASREGSVEQLVDEPGTGSAFLNIFGQAYVGPMDTEDVTELIVFPSTNIGEPFQSEQVEYIRLLGGQHAFFLQIACYHTLETQRSGTSGANARNIVESKFTYEAEPHMKYLAGRLSSTEVAALQDWLGPRTEKPKEGYTSLFRKGILIDDAEPRIFSSVFANYVCGVQSPRKEASYGKSRNQTLRP